MMKLLVADDESLVRSFIRAVLEKENLPVSELIEAADGAEAVSLCSQKRPQAVLMDLRMPTMDGLAATRLIARDFPETRVSVISAHEDFELVRQAFQLGVRDYLLKPVGAEELTGLILKMERTLAAPAEGELIGAVARFVDGHLSESFGLPDLARALFISPAHLSRKFKKLSGRPLSEFIQGRRVARAAELLAQTSLSVSEVAAAVGFGNPAYFATYFKAHTGRSPGNYRRQGAGDRIDAG